MVAEPEGLGGAKECLAVVGLSPLLVVLELLGFAYVEGGDVELSPSCRTFAKVDILRRKEISAEHRPSLSLPVSAARPAARPPGPRSAS